MSDTLYIPRATHVLLEEGGKWEPWKEGSAVGLVHGIRFSDGSVWDTVNGWRFGVADAKDETTKLLNLFSALATHDTDCPGSPCKCGAADIGKKFYFPLLKRIGAL